MKTSSSFFSIGTALFSSSLKYVYITVRDLRNLHQRKLTILILTVKYKDHKGFVEV